MLAIRMLFWAALFYSFGVVRGQDFQAKTDTDKLRQEFVNPPQSAWPRTWWHWTGGAVSLDGITRDLEWMHRVGITGFQLADVSFGAGQTVDPRIEFGSAEWLAAVKHAAVEAKRLGLEMAIFSSPGWSMTGGPWVKPEQAMKKLVWSEMQLSGPQQFQRQLPQPPTNNGVYQDMGAGRRSDATFFKDVRVLAWRTPAVERRPVPTPQVSSSSPNLEDAKLRDGSFTSAVTIAAPTDGGPAWVQYAYDEPVTVRAITISGPAGIPVGHVTASDDGKTYRTILTLPGAHLYRQGRVRTFAVPVTTDRLFRLELTGAPLQPAATMREDPPQPAKNYALFEWQLHTGARVHRAEEKAGFSFLYEYETVATPSSADSGAIARQDIVDLSEKLQPDGTLDWKVPTGDWTVLRLGYSLTGAKNRPTTPAGSGYEVDKLSRQHTETYYDNYAGPIARELGELYGKSLQYLLIDSWEAGYQNWTDDMIAEFASRRGYDPTAYLPVLCGRVVDSARTSDRFLWDFRRTLADMFAENHYAVLSERLHQDGLGVYSEASGVSLEIPEDTLLNKSKVDIPMGEFWVRDLHPRLMYLQDVRGAASAAHAYGKPLVAAESFTGGGYESPFTLKKVGDYWLAQGINRLVFHTSAHQPLDTKPGNMMVGTHLNRNITWAELAKPFNTYLARCCYMLQQGLPVVDIAYLLDEGAPSTMPIWGSGTRPAPPEGYDYDFLNADVLLHRLAVAEDGRLVLPGGMSYRVLVLPETRQMRPELLEKLQELVEGGATIVGPRPRSSPSLSGQPQADDRVEQVAEALWGDLNGTNHTIRYVGKGMVVWGRRLTEVLQRLQISKDLQYAGQLDSELAWKHRSVGNDDIYYVSNLSDLPETLQIRFRVANRQAELWRPDSGMVSTIVTTLVGERTELHLPMDPHETLFVVFRERHSDSAVREPTQSRRQIHEVSGPWEVTFLHPGGTDMNEQLDELRSWTTFESREIQYFSGTAVYQTQFELGDQWTKEDGELWLDLGDVRDIAELEVNDKPLGTLWKPPYSANVTAALQPGVNRLQVRVTDEWTNYYLNEKGLPPMVRGLATRGLSRGPNPAPEVSGLLGPVRVLVRE